MANTKEITASPQDLEAIHCLTIPLHNEVALLPNSAIAEVITYKEPAPIDDAPDWFFGYIEWREKRVPIISFEAVSGKEAAAAVKNSRIAILNTLNGNAQLPYIGMVSQGIPSLAIVQEHGMEEKALSATDRPTVAAFVEVGGIQALIPDIDEIEQRLIRLTLS